MNNRIRSCRGSLVLGSFFFLLPLAVELYLTPMPAGESAGFLAFKYVYSQHSRAPAP